jgi:CRISPR/Cas system CSM-associated protein Csm2 small subunit
MILDSEEQRELLLQILQVINVPMAQIEKFYALKNSIANAEIKEEVKDIDTDNSESFR